MQARSGYLGMLYFVFSCGGVLQPFHQCTFIVSVFLCCHIFGWVLESVVVLCLKARCLGVCVCVPRVDAIPPNRKKRSGWRVGAVQENFKQGNLTVSRTRNECWRTL